MAMPDFFTLRCQRHAPLAQEVAVEPLHLLNEPSEHLLQQQVQGLYTRYVYTCCRPWVDETQVRPWLAIWRVCRHLQAAGFPKVAFANSKPPSSCVPDYDAAANKE